MAYQLKTTNIKGKEYVQVNERIIALRKLPEYKGYSIETEMVAIDSDTCVMKATIRDSKGTIAATGFAQEDRSASMINKTSYVENCETSAVGRALGFLGIGVESSIATAEEVSLAIAKQDMGVTPKASAKATPQVLDQEKAAEHIKAGTNAPERKKRFDAVMSKYGDVISAEQAAALRALVTA
jgi:hypothetical protein